MKKNAIIAMTFCLCMVAFYGKTMAQSVYAVGQKNNKAIIWKNGEETYLEGGAVAYSVYVSNNNDVYVAGERDYEDQVSLSRAMFWKNGTPTYLTNGMMTWASARSVFVSGNDVYVAGYETEDASGSVAIAKIWKNGTPINLSTGNKSYILNSVFISGNDMYAAGDFLESSSNKRAEVWKNDVMTNLSTKQSTANSVFVSGNDVYVAGNEFVGNSGSTWYYAAKVWKNGIPVTLTPDANTKNNANSVFVSGSDVYVAGTEGGDNSYRAKVWKNGVATTLSDGNYNTEARGIFLYENDVYVAGYSSFGARIWKNGIMQSLTNIGNPKAYSVFVVPTNNAISSVAPMPALTISPNPATDWITLSSEQLRINSVDIADIAGRIISIHAAPQQEAEIYVSHLLQGLYLLKIHTDQGIITRKFVKQ